MVTHTLARRRAADRARFLGIVGARAYFIIFIERWAEGFHTQRTFIGFYSKITPNIMPVINVAILSSRSLTQTPEFSAV